MREKIFEARDVVIKFNLRGRTLTAIRHASIDLYQGETLAIVGESGSGKSVFTKSFIGMLDKNGWVESGSMRMGDVDFSQYKTEKEWLQIRGKKIAMVFQDPMTSLNPVKTVGEQIREVITYQFGTERPRPSSRPSSFCARWGSAIRSSATGSTPTSSPAACARGWSSPRPSPAGLRS